MKKQIVIVLFLLFSISLSAQNYQKLEHKVLKKETLYKISILYQSTIDSIQKWNDLSGTHLDEGRTLLIKDYNFLSLDDIRCNQLVYEKEHLINEMESFQKHQTQKIDSLENYKNSIDSDNPNSMQLFFVVAKDKKKIEKESIKKQEEFETKIKEKENSIALCKQKNKKEEIVDEIEAEVKTDTNEEKIEEVVTKKNEEEKEEKGKKEEVKVNVSKEEKLKKEEKQTEFVQNQIEEIDTSSKQYKKAQKKLEKEIARLENIDKEMTTVTVEEVELLENKKKKKYKIGDEVDQVSKEKSMFFLSRAKLEIDKRNYKKAIEFTNKSIQFNPNHTEAYLLKGDIMASFGYFDKAIKVYETAIETGNLDPQVFYNLGNCLYYEGKKQKALDNMNQAIELDRDYVLAYSGRSQIYMDMEDYEGALADFNEILERNRYYYPALKGKGMALYHLNRFNEAIIVFDQYLVYEDREADIYYFRGLSRLGGGEYYVACMDFLTAAEMGYTDADKAIQKYCE